MEVSEQDSGTREHREQEHSTIVAVDSHTSGTAGAPFMYSPSAIEAIDLEEEGVGGGLGIVVEMQTRSPNGDSSDEDDAKTSEGRTVTQTERKGTTRRKREKKEKLLHEDDSLTDTASNFSDRGSEASAEQEDESWKDFLALALQSDRCPPALPPLEKDDAGAREEDPWIPGGRLHSPVPPEDETKIEKEARLEKKKLEREEKEKERDAAIKALALMLRVEFYSELRDYNIADTPTATPPFFHDVLSVILLHLPNDLPTLASVRLTCRTWHFFANHLPHWSSYTLYASIYSKEQLNPKDKEDEIPLKSQKARLFEKMDVPFTGSLFGLTTLPGRGSYQPKIELSYEEYAEDTNFEEGTERKLSIVEEERAIGVLLLSNPKENVRLELSAPPLCEGAVYAAGLIFDDFSARAAELQNWRMESKRLQKSAFVHHRLWISLLYWTILVSAYFVAVHFGMNPEVTQTDGAVGAATFFSSLAFVIAFFAMVLVFLGKFDDSGIRSRDITISYDPHLHSKPSAVWSEVPRHWSLYLVLMAVLFVSTPPIGLLFARVRSLELLQSAPIFNLGTVDCFTDDSPSYGYFDVEEPFNSPSRRWSPLFTNPPTSTTDAASTASSSASASSNSGSSTNTSSSDISLGGRNSSSSLAASSSSSSSSSAAVTTTTSAPTQAVIHARTTLEKLQAAWPGCVVGGQVRIVGGGYKYYVVTLQRRQSPSLNRTCRASTGESYFIALEVSKPGGDFYTAEEVLHGLTSSGPTASPLANQTLYRNMYYSGVEHFSEVAAHSWHDTGNGVANVYYEADRPRTYALVYYNRPADEGWYDWLTMKRQELITAHWVITGIAASIALVTWILTFCSKHIQHWTLSFALGVLFTLCNPINCFVAGLVCIIDPPEAFMCSTDSGIGLVIIGVIGIGCMLSLLADD